MPDYSTPAELLMILDMREAVASGLATVADSLDAFRENARRELVGLSERVEEEDQ